MITVIDYGAGNLKSVVNALSFLGERPVVSRDADEIARADKLLLPGVGAFGECMKSLNVSGIADAVKSAAKRGVPLLGICLGMQLLFGYSTEFGRKDGLSLIPGGVEALSAPGRKLPHIAWTSIDVTGNGRLLRGIGSGEFFYFVHGYRAKALSASDEAATATYGETFTAAVERDNVMGTQFHPEKSGEAGLKILKNFISV